MALARTLLRRERKLQTRHALMDGALDLMAEGRGFGALSLREIARAARVVPTAFYRHFRDLDELGLTLVDEAFLTLRRLMRDVRHEVRGARAMGRDSVHVYLRYVRDHRRVFEFVARERYGGSPPVRAAIAREVRFFVSELADDLAAMPALQHLDAPAREVVAHLIVSTMATLTGDVLDLADDARERVDDLAARAITQLEIATLGAAAWRRRD